MSNLNLGGKREEYYRSKNNFQSNSAKGNNNRKRTKAKERNINSGGCRKVKVRNFLCATVDDLNHHISPLLQKRPSNIIVHTGTNDAYHSMSREIFNELLSFKSLLR